MAMKPYMCSECGKKCWSLTEIAHSRPRCPDCWSRFVNESNHESDEFEHFIDQELDKYNEN